MARRPVTVHLEDDVVRRAEAAAAEAGEPLGAVIERALAVHLGLGALAQMQAAFDSDPDEADRIAHEEQRAYRSGR